MSMASVVTFDAPVVAVDPRKDLLLNGSIEKLPRLCESMEELIHEVRKYPDNDSYFMQIFPLFLDRVFGESVMENSSEPTWVRGDKGGWLKRAAETTRVGVTANKSVDLSRSRRTESASAFITQYGMSDYAAKLLCLFEGPISKMINDDQYHHHLLNVSFEALPKKVKMKLQGIPSYKCIRSATNHAMYDHWCQRNNLIVSNLMSTPNQSAVMFGAQNNFNNGNGSGSNVIVNLNLQTYFFVAFLRYPTVEVDVFPQRSGSDDLFTKFFNDSGNIARWSKGNPYLFLLGRYLHRYVPLVGSNSPAAHDFPDHNVQFLQIAIDYWIDTALVVKHEFDKVAGYKEDYLRQGSSLPHTTSSFLASGLERSPPTATPMMIEYGSGTPGRSGYHGAVSSQGRSPRTGSYGSPRVPAPHPHQQGMARAHPAATEVISLENVSNKAFLPTRNTMQCIYMLVHHCMTRMTSEFLANELSLQTTTLQKYGSSLRRGDLLLESLPLPYTMMTLQQPLFDLLRVIFKADGIDLRVFTLAVEVWHLWLSPWRRLARQVNAKATPQQQSKLQTLKATVLESSVKESVEYDAKKWEFYVASNLHFYSTLFVLFLQSPTLTRDLALSTSAGGVTVLSKTLKLFSKPLLNTLDYLNKGYSLAGGGLDVFLHDCVTLQDRQMFPGLAAHESCAVVEFRIASQNQSKVIIEILRGRNRDDTEEGYLEAGIRTMIDGVMSLCGLPVTVMSPDRQHELKGIELQLTEITCLKASDLSGLGTKLSGEHKLVQQDAERVTELTHDASGAKLGSLTTLGKSQVLHGTHNCDKSSITYRKDPLSRPFLSTDLKYPVKILIHLSKTMNDHFGFPLCDDSVYFTWEQMVSRAVHKYETDHGASTSHVIVKYFYDLYLYLRLACWCLPQGFRVNLRCLGNVIFLSKMVMFMTAVLCYLGFISVGVLGAVLVTLFVTLHASGWHQS